jgi:hypothetical protein
MHLSEMQRQTILREFIEAFQQKYGEEWINNLTKPLRPSPIRHISEKYGVKISEVRKIRQQFMVLGHFVQLQYLLVAPISPTNDILVPEW